MALSEKLAELDASMVAAKQWVRAVGGEVRAAKAELDEARNPVVEGYAAGSDEAAISWLATEAEVMSLMRLVWQESRPHSGASGSARGGCP